jgi:putative endonuclease
MEWKKYPAVYIMANKRGGTLYVGVTSNLPKRAWEHRNNLFGGFTDKYRCHNLVYYEFFDEMKQAIEREKQIKAGPRKRKVELIEKTNGVWKDLYETLI